MNYLQKIRNSKVNIVKHNVRSKQTANLESGSLHKLNVSTIFLKYIVLYKYISKCFNESDFINTEVILHRWLKHAHTHTSTYRHTHKRRTHIHTHARTHVAHTHAHSNSVADKACCHVLNKYNTQDGDINVI